MKIIKEANYNYDFINPTKEDNPKWADIPSFRGSHQLIIYTDNYFLKTKNNHTGVNSWGHEAAVNEKGVVVEISDRVAIPNGGFVLSGTDEAANFIKDNFLLGSEVTINENKTVTVKTNILKANLISFKDKKKKMLKKYKVSLNKAYGINKKEIDLAFLKIEEIQKSLNKIVKLSNPKSKDILKFNKLINKANKLFDKIYLLASESKIISSRNAWMRPSQQNLKEITDMLEVCKSCGINGLYVESFYNGDIPGISKITDTNKEVKNGYYGETYKNDYLYALISEAHKRNIEVHAWVECFFVGELSSQWKSKYKDEWHMVNYDGSTIQGNNDEHNENDFVWLDPANPECLSYVLSIYEELLTKYDFDGINVDYVRYPHGNLRRYSSNGYTQYAMDEFKRINNLSGDVKELIEDPNIYELWVTYRCNKITLLMSEIRKLVNRVKPNCYISTSVCSDLNYAIYNKMQNWKLWARNSWLDLTMPMAYYIGCSEIAVATKELVDFNKENAFSYTGIMCMSKDLPAMLVVQQINTLFENGADGYALFQLQDILNRKEIQRNLKLSVNRVRSVHPHNDPKLLIKYFIKDLRRRKTAFNSDITLSINKLAKINDFSLNNLVYKLKEIKNEETNKILKKEIGTLIHFIKVQIDLKKHKTII